MTDNSPFDFVVVGLLWFVIIRQRIEINKAEKLMANTTLYGLTAEHIAKLQELAHSLGYVAERGAGRGHGSASALIRAIAEGELTLIAKRPDDVSFVWAEDNALIRCGCGNEVFLSETEPETCDCGRTFEYFCRVQELTK